MKNKYLTIDWSGIPSRPEKKVSAIKAYRTLTLCDLSTAKDFVEKSYFHGRVNISNKSITQDELSDSIFALNQYGMYAVLGCELPEGSLEAGLRTVAVQAVNEGDYGVAEQLLGILRNRTRS